MEDQDLYRFFGGQGVSLDSVKIVYDRETGRSKGFAFAYVSSKKQLDQLLSLNGINLEGRPLKINGSS